MNCSSNLAQKNSVKERLKLPVGHKALFAHIAMVRLIVDFPMVLGVTGSVAVVVKKSVYVQAPYSTRQNCRCADGSRTLFNQSVQKLYFSVRINASNRGVLSERMASEA